MFDGRWPWRATVTDATGKSRVVYVVPRWLVAAVAVSGGIGATATLLSRFL